MLTNEQKFTIALPIPKIILIIVLATKEKKPKIESTILVKKLIIPFFIEAKNL